MTEGALDFLEANKQAPIFLYYATWLVHTPIQSRSKALLQKYCQKLGVDFPTDPDHWRMEGQNNPYYCAMVETLDHYVGKIVKYLETTEDPRWPGHKLIENTWIIFSSDNGGMEGHPGEVITDNYPLDRGKISAMEGGTRVPFLVAGPGVPAGVESEVMVNGLDFYPDHSFAGWNREAGGEKTLTAVIWFRSSSVTLPTPLWCARPAEVFVILWSGTSRIAALSKAHSGSAITNSSATTTM